MKTIKELDKANIMQPIYHPTYSDGYKQALKDVLGLIDEHLNNPANCTTACMQELKARISG